MRCKVQTSRTNDMTRRDRFLGALMEALIPYLKLKWSNMSVLLHGIEWVYKLGYLLGRTMYFTPSLHLLKMVIRRVTIADLKGSAENSNNPSLYYKGLTLTLTALLISIPAYYTQIKQYILHSKKEWISQQSSLKNIPPPIPSSQVDILLNQCNSSRIGICPLCQCVFINPSLCSVSGYVGCYRCFVMFVRENGRCPVTALPCSESSVIRIYETTL